MVTFRNNNARRNNFRRGERNFKSNGDRTKFTPNFSNGDNFQRKIPNRNNHNAPKLIEKYNNLAREALSSGDKILSENYFQHADHFTRVSKEQENFRKNKFEESSKKSSAESLSQSKETKNTDEVKTEVN
ncbi:DUF4167 domain-containing protein [Pelagibacterales bacterium SAG-MED19]|nr:DUF4167 domain-containing protein [Pelagibacterales bacterium SAG-MED19]